MKPMHNLPMREPIADSNQYILRQVMISVVSGLLLIIWHQIGFIMRLKKLEYG